MNGTLQLRRQLAAELSLGAITLLAGLTVVVGGIVLPGGFGAAGAFGNIMAFVMGAALAVFGVATLRSVFLARRGRRLP